MENYLWLVYALLSAVAAAMVSVFGKIGLQGLDAHTATAVRAVIMAAFFGGRGRFSAPLGASAGALGRQKSNDLYSFERRGGSVVLAVLFYGIKIRQGFPSGPGGQVERRFGGHGGGCFSA